MRKKLLSIAIIITTVISLSGCNKKNNTVSATEAQSNNIETQSNSIETTTENVLDYMTTDTSNKDISAEQYNDFYKSTAKQYQKYIKLPPYTIREKVTENTDDGINSENVDAFINDILKSYSSIIKIPNGTTAVGDSIVLNYRGTINGEAFPFGTATDVTYTIGSEKFITDLDKALVGLNVGTIYYIPCTYPNDYSYAELRGKNVVFEVKVTAINQYILPELTDEWVANHAEELGIEETTVEGFRAFVANYIKSYSNTIISEIKEKSNINDYPKKEFDSLETVYMENLESEYDNSREDYAQKGILDYNSYIEYVLGCEFEDEFAFKETITKYVKDYLLEKMIITLIGYENNITVSAQEIYDLGEECAEEYGYNNYNEIIEEYGKIINAELGYEILSDKVKKFIKNNHLEISSENS